MKSPGRPLQSGALIRKASSELSDVPAQWFQLHEWFVGAGRFCAKLKRFREQGKNKTFQRRQDVELNKPKENGRRTWDILHWFMSTNTFYHMSLLLMRQINTPTRPFMVSMQCISSVLNVDFYLTHPSIFKGWKAQFLKWPLGAANPNRPPC